MWCCSGPEWLPASLLTLKLPASNACAVEALLQESVQTVLDSPAPMDAIERVLVTGAAAVWKVRTE